MEDYNGTTLIISAFVFFGLLFLLRFVVTWYYKIDARLEEQEKTNRLLLKIIEQNEKMLNK